MNNNDILEKIELLFPNGLLTAETALSLRISGVKAKLADSGQHNISRRAIISDDKYLEHLLELKLLTNGQDALSKLKRGWPISSSEESGLEAIIDEQLPFLTIENGKIELPENWNFLQPGIEQITKTIRSVGRIQQKGEGLYRGTGFLVAKDIVMTNWHVIRDLMYPQNGNFKFYPHIHLSINFNVEYPVIGNSAHIITDFLFRHPLYDLVLLKIETIENTPMALQISTKKIDSPTGLPVYVIGHPYTDTRYGADLHVQWRLMSMGKSVGYKHLCLGYLHKTENYLPDSVLNYPEMPYLSHMVSTLPGNSGSCVIDASTHKVIGLHCAGDNQKKKNYAVPIWNVEKSLMQYNLSYE